MVVKQLEQIVPMVGAGSPIGEAVLKALQSLAKHVPPGAVPPGVEQSTMQQAMQRQRQNATLMAAMQAARAQGNQGNQQQPPQAAA